MAVEDAAVSATAGKDDFSALVLQLQDIHRSTVQCMDGVSRVDRVLVCFGVCCLFVSHPSSEGRIEYETGRNRAAASGCEKVCVIPVAAGWVVDCS